MIIENSNTDPEALHENSKMDSIFPLCLDCIIYCYERNEMDIDLCFCLHFSFCIYFL